MFKLLENRKCWAFGPWKKKIGWVRSTFIQLLPWEYSPIHIEQHERKEKALLARSVGRSGLPEWQDNVKGMRRLTEHVCQGHIWSRNDIQSKECLKLNSKKTTQKWPKESTRHVTKEEMQMVSNHVKSCSTSYVIREMPIRAVITSITIAKT